MFGTSGIRGIYGKDITEELASGIAGVFADGKLVLGRDIRESGMPLFKAATKGAFSSRADVIDLGIVPTPTVALATKKHGCRGIMLTASHNPPEYNGLKLIEHGKEIGKVMEQEVTKEYERWVSDGGAIIADIIKQEPFPKLTIDSSIIEDHKIHVKEQVDGSGINRKKPKVIVDCNGAAAVITPYLLTDLGCNVISVNASTNGFNRPSEPSKENISYLAGVVRECGADFAIAHDGDGDRCVIMDDQGEVLPLDVQLAMMIEHELGKSNNKKIISTVEASLVIREVVERAGGKIEITPVGSTHVGDALEETGALFGGEPCGEYIYQKGVHVPDAVLAAAKFVEMFVGGSKFSELKKKYQQNPIAREKFKAPDKRKSMEKIKQEMNIPGRIRDDDGIRVDEEDGWFLVRASGTEPIIRLTMEYKSDERLEQRKKELVRLIKNNI
ncbi:putative phosphoglucosamine mutase [Candidatus Bilamarchaeum dharawalense]|uniref:Putative phosphoglucosamine mutase n=1 Tax=Candidatus Bilamarchaeum dharawalense TaxID=2885759 RepID=A0A5E4LTX1_9ARCH|nr:putative phosphoglucosamine mutase [Candidatus Bilamarchaeum dharawalense]